MIRLNEEGRGAVTAALFENNLNATLGKADPRSSGIQGIKSSKGGESSPSNNFSHDVAYCPTTAGRLERNDDDQFTSLVSWFTRKLRFSSTGCDFTTTREKHHRQSSISAGQLQSFQSG